MLKKNLLMTFSLAAAAAWLWSAPALAQDEDKAGDKAAATEEADESETLTVGSKAPAIDIEHWVSDGGGKFKPVTELESGKVYVVEFWATWCGPCIASMPHLAETQAKYADKGVQLISVSDEDLATVEEFLKKPVDGEEEAGEEDEEGEKTDAKAKKTFGELTSVYCLTADPDMSTHKAYFEAAGQSGIPCCFIVGKDGMVEWIGHPMEMDEPLEQVVDGSWDRDAYLAEFKKQQEAEAEAQKKAMAQRKFLMPIIELAQSGDFDGALDLIKETREKSEGNEDELEALSNIEGQIRSVSVMQMLQDGELEDAAGAVDEFTAGTDNPTALNQVAWTIYEMAAEDDDFPKDLIKAATAAAEKGVKANPTSGAILDTLAHLEHLNGNLDRAIELQTKALENPESFEDDIKEFLEQLKKEKADK